MRMRQTAAIIRAIVFSCLALSSPAWAAGADEAAGLTRTIEALQAQLHELRMRLETLEAEASRREQELQKDAARETEKAKAQAAKAESTEVEDLKRRIEELEKEKTAQEEAVRSIIQSTFSKMGSKINEFVTLGGAVEVAAARTKDFGRPSFVSSIGLSTAEFDFEIQPNDWTLGSIVFEYIDGSAATFQASQGFQTGVDRFNLDTADFRVGDPRRFPPFARLGRMILPFGTSTGVHRSDVLSIDSPMTTDAFEMRKTAIGFGLGFPTPAQAPPSPPVVAPPVRPLVFTPFVRAVSKGLGYDPPPTRPAPPAPFTPPPVQPLFSTAVYFYDGNPLTSADGRSKPFEHVAATAGLHASGSCGRPYHELRWTNFCPWSLDLDVDYNSSVFESRFLEEEYRAFLRRIGFVRGIAAHVKSSVGPVSLVGEWNGALKRATFLDDVGTTVSMKPSAWQVTLGLQLGWNPWVESIGGQGTFLSFGYSQTRDLAGVTQVINGETSRVGSSPKRRLLLSAGEYVLDGVKFTIEYSYNWDYPISENGTGLQAKGIFTSFTYAW